MKLPIPFITGKKETSAYYLALLLTDEKTSAVILEEQNGKIKIVNTQEEPIHTPLETIDLQQMIQIVDKTISRAEEVLPPDRETHKTIFGVKDSWIDPEDKKIKKEYLNKLKKLCDALDLTPIGFMVITEALAFLMQQEEGAPLSAILAEIGKHGATLTLVRGGKVVESKHSHIEESAPATIDKLLRHFTVPVLPARIILFQTSNNEKLSQQFISHQWSKGLPFLHVPQISVLPTSFDAKAVAYGAATQMGFYLIGLSQHEPLTDLKVSTAMTDETGEKEPAGIPDDALTNNAEEPIIPAVSSKPSEFGFLINEDIADIEPVKKHVAEEQDEHHQHEMITNKPPQTVEEEFVNEREFEEEEIEEQETPHGRKKRSIPGLGALTGLFGGIKGILPANFGGKKVGLIIVGVVILLLVLGGFGLVYAYYNKVQATVIVTVTPKIVDEKSDITFSTSNSNDFSKNVIAAKNVTASVDGNTSVATTGKKDVGDKAKGSVTIYNSSSSPSSLSSGTSIKSSNGLVYYLDKDSTVASASGDIFSGTKPGTTQVSVTAKDIGTDYNLPSGTTFSVGSDSSLAAKNDSAFSGGSKKTVQVVSNDDLAKLKTALSKSLEDKAKDALSQKASGDETVLPFIVDRSVDKASYDKKLEDEAKKVTLTGTINYTGISYQNDDLKNYIQTLLKSKYSSDISFADNSIKNTVTETKLKDDTDVTGNLVIEAGLLPKIDTTQIADNLKEKQLKDAKEYLSKLPQVSQSDISFSPNIPILPNFLHLPKQITVQLKSGE